jgi:Ser/Thr protein kinase RdoA (MazF antagonist)
MPDEGVAFEELSTASQVRRLRPAAFAALAAWPIEVARLRLLHHGFNTTFRVDTTGGRRFALRLNVNSRRSDANILAETSWVAALATDTDLRVPVPMATHAGGLVTHVASAALGRDLPAVLYSWLPGPDLDDLDVTEAQMREVGRAMATLHGHATTWSLPAGAELAVIDTVLMDSADNIAADHPLLSSERRAVIDAASARAATHLAEIFAGQSPMVLHTDLHNANLKWCRGRLYVFDFDDTALGLPVQDLAIAAYYLRDDLHLEAALLEGYQALRPLPAYTQDQFEAFVAARNIVLLNDLLAIGTADLRALLGRYVPNTVAKLRQYLDTGQYRHDIPGLV